MAASLPIYSLPFIGREDELRQITTLLNDPACRLLTLLGTGGIGKTRLAIEAVRLKQDAYEHGGYFVPFQPLTAPEFIVPAIAEALNFQFFPGGDPKLQLLDFFRSKSLLLVLDNFEHLLAGVGIVSEILAAASSVKVLTTSRERLSLLEEWVLEVGGLSFPQNVHDIPIEHYSAIQLFVENARRVRVGFTLSDAQRPAVMRICQLVGGMPLGIELASAWVRTLSCEDIAAEIERSLDILATSTRNIAERHRDMRAVFEYSWALLSDTERAVFMQLSVFQGGFRKEAAQTVAGASLQSLSALVDKSLLRLNADGRYELHELLRQFGEEKLKGDSLLNTQTQDRHSIFYAELLSHHCTDLKGSSQRQALDAITADFENVRAAWSWTTAQRHHALVKQMVEGLHLFCYLRSRYQEALELFDHARKQFASDSSEEAERTWGSVTARWADFWLRQVGGAQGDAQVRSEVHKSLSIARAAEDTAEIAYDLYVTGLFDYVVLDLQKAAPPFEESLALYTRLNDRYEMANLAHFLAETYSRDFDRFDHFMRQSIDLRLQLGDRNGLASALDSLRMQAIGNGDFQEAERLLRESDAIYRELGSEVGVARNGFFWARIAFHRGDFEEIETLAQHALNKVSQATISNKPQGLYILSLVTSMRGDYVLARQMAERIGTHDPDYDAPRALAIAACGLGDDLAARQQLLLTFLHPSEYRGQQEFAQLTMLPVAAILLAREGELQQAVEILALVSTYPSTKVGWMEKWPLLAQIQAELEAELPAGALSATWERGKTRSLAEVVNRLIERWRPEQHQSSVQHANQLLTDPLTDRELQILRLLSTGLSTHKVAQQLFLTTGTVRWYLNQIYSKLDVHSRVHAIARASELHLLD